MSKKENTLLQQWHKDENALFRGWDFSYLKGRYSEGNPDWNYMLIAKKLIKKSKSVIDMATGGGEIYSELLSAYKPSKIVAIEGYKKNVLVARKHLQNYNCNVIYANETKKLPFNNKEFNLVLNRHGGINSDSICEIHRILSFKREFSNATGRW
jgi:ubiquinone/menaquinone biosynthesis C-methylase UbiE